MATIISLSAIQRIRGQVERMRRELEEKTGQLEEARRELTALKSAAARQPLPNDREHLALDQEKLTLSKKLREVELAMARTREQAAAGKKGIQAANLKQEEVEVKRLEGEVGRLRAEAARAERALADKRGEFEKMKRENSATGNTTVAAMGETASLEGEHDALERKLRDTDTAINREETEATARTSKGEQRAGDITAKTTAVKKLEAEVERLRAGSLRAEQTLEDMGEKLKQARMRPAA
ncbi:MAG: hypothetical protein Q8R35_02035 [bacterium]|nr:hypothetical protein [bacterium]